MAALLAAALIVLAPCGGYAQGFPAKPVKIVIGFAPGGSVDVLARILGIKLGELWGQPLVIENRVGAGGNLATEVVVKSPADGYTLLLHTLAIAINASLYAKLPFDAARDLAPVSKVASTNGVMLVPPSLEVKSVTEFLALARSQPGKLSYATTGSGSSGHLFMVLFISLTGIDMVHVPYKNASQQQTDLVAGRTQVAINTLPGAVPFIKSGKLRALAVTDGRRSQTFPDLPTMREAGVPAYEAVTWYGMFAPAGIPGSVVARVNGDLERVLALPDARERFAASALDPQGGPTATFAAFFQQEIAKWAKIIKATGMQVE